MTSIKSAIVCAYHASEDDLAETTKSAMKSAGKGAKFYAVQDRDESGPGRNRHRGIEAASDADVIVIIDAHMRFRGNVLRRLISEAYKGGRLLVPFCHHNEDCSFTGNGGAYYAGARIVFRSRDGQQFKPLDAKWSKDQEPGERGCVMGACYAFRRDWYMGAAGQPLSILTGWGGDEQALSISMWMTGGKVEVINGHVAHRYRPRPPWTPSQKALDAVHASRSAMIQAFVSDVTDRRELHSWANIREPAQATPEVDRLRAAMLAAPRNYRQWKSEVCEPDEIDGRQSARTSSTRVDRNHTPNICVPRHGIVCPHCGTCSEKPRVTHTYDNGNKRHICPACGNPFMSFPANVAAVNGLN